MSDLLFEQFICKELPQSQRDFHSILVDGIRYFFVKSSILWYAIRVYVEHVSRVPKNSIRGWNFKNFSIIDHTFKYFHENEHDYVFIFPELIEHSNFLAKSSLEKKVESFKEKISPYKKLQEFIFRDRFSEELSEDELPKLSLDSKKLEESILKIYPNKELAKVFIKNGGKYAYIRTKTMDSKVIMETEIATISKRSFLGEIYSKYQSSSLILFPFKFKYVYNCDGEYKFVDFEEIFSFSSKEFHKIKEWLSFNYKLHHEKNNKQIKVLDENIEDLRVEIPKFLNLDREGIEHNVNFENHSKNIIIKTETLLFRFEKAKLKIGATRKYDPNGIGINLHSTKRYYFLSGQNSNSEWKNIKTISDNFPEFKTFLISFFQRKDWMKCFPNFATFHEINSIEISHRQAWSKLKLNEVLEILQPGSVLLIPKRFYMHVGVLLEKGEVVHIKLNGIKNYKTPEKIFVKVPFHEFIEKKKNIIERRFKIKKFTLQELEERAAAMITREFTYNIKNNNCEHFANELVNDYKYCSQLNSYFKYAFAGFVDKKKLK